MSGSRKLITPEATPHDFGFTKEDFHIIASAATGKATAFDASGKKLWVVRCLLQGQRADWRLQGGDTPPGLYKLGALINDYAEVGSNPRYTPELQSYGWMFFDLIDIAAHEDRNRRAGVGAHGGGTALGWPYAWEPHQALVPTLGCPRFENAALRDQILPLYLRGTVFFSVHQFALARNG